MIMIFQNTNAKRGRGEYLQQKVYQNIIYFDSSNQPKNKGKE
jgi:hypothetical protein